jgi:hypothetical protein
MGRGLVGPGEWMWLCSWPTALTFLLAIGASQGSLQFFAVGAVATYFVVFGLALAAGRQMRTGSAAPIVERVPGPVPGSAVFRIHFKAIWLWTLANALLWIIPVAGANHGEIFLLAGANVLLWVALAWCAGRMPGSIGHPSRAWTHWVGLSLATAMPAVLCLFG